MSLAPAPVVYRSTIARGDGGVLETVAALRPIVQDSMASPVLVETARELAHYGGPDPTNQARVIRHWLTQVFHFVSDPVKAEHTGTPAYLLGRLAQLGYISGD